MLTIATRLTNICAVILENRNSGESRASLIRIIFNVGKGIPAFGKPGTSRAREMLYRRWLHIHHARAR